MTASAPALVVEGLTVEIRSGHRRMQPVRNVSLTVEAGETLGIVGESGCGKSTLLLAVLGLLPTGASIVSGRILIAGRDVAQLRGTEQRALRGKVVGMVFQDASSALNPVMRIGRQLVDGAQRHLHLRRAAARELARELLVRVGVPDPERRLSAYPHELSGGLRQRVMIAMALATKPSLLLCDEPTTALDVTIQNQVLNVISDAQRDVGLALVYVTHNIAVVRQLCDRVIVMYAGQLLESGDTADVLDRSRHPYTAALVSAAPDIDHPDAPIHTIGGSPPDLWFAEPGCPFAPRCVHHIADCDHGEFPLLPGGSACRRREHEAIDVMVHA
ncbi:MAG TPA: ABC transporter ATP-binding protein [Jatrophihabitantaceae bacterium]